MNMGTANWVRCTFTGCFQCCLLTEMLLTNDEVKNIVSLGYKKEDFLVPSNTDGLNQLANIPSKLGKKCFFLTDEGKCSLYKAKDEDHRPRGCKIYPLIVDVEENAVIIDTDCRETLWFQNQTYSPDQFNSVIELVQELLQEEGEFE